MRPLSFVTSFAAPSKAGMRSCKGQGAKEKGREIPALSSCAVQGSLAVAEELEHLCIEKKRNAFVSVRLFSGLVCRSGHACKHYVLTKL